jgi:hypothetical protein
VKEATYWNVKNIFICQNEISKLIN